MALRISPILSTPHFILLHAGCFTVPLQQWLEETGKVVPLFFPREKSNRLQITAPEKAFYHSPTELASLKTCHSVLLQQDWGLINASGDQLRGLTSVLASGDVGTRSLSPSTRLPVGVFACDKAPHCCSDVSSLCPPSHDRHTQPYWSSPERTRCQGFPFGFAPPNCLPFWLRPSHPPTSQTCWVVQKISGCYRPISAVWWC